MFFSFVLEFKSNFSIQTNAEVVVHHTPLLVGFSVKGLKAKAEIVTKDMSLFEKKTINMNKLLRIT